MYIGSRSGYLDRFTNVENLWGTEYKSRSRYEASMEKSRRDREPNLEYQDFLEPDISSDDSESPDAQSDEFNSWQSLRPEKAVTNPIEYWKTNKHLWPRLARMAFNTLGVLAMSLEIERTFSDVSQIVTNRQNRLHSETIGACLCLKQWDKAGIVKWPNSK